MSTLHQPQSAQAMLDWEEYLAATNHFNVEDLRPAYLPLLFDKNRSAVNAPPGLGGDASAVGEMLAFYQAVIEDHAAPCTGDIVFETN